MADAGGPDPAHDQDGPSFDVRPVAPGRRFDGRLAAAALALVLVAAAGVSLLDRFGDGAAAPSPSPPRASPPTPTRAPREARERPASPRPSPSLPAIGAGPLPGAPRAVFIERRGTDAALVEWDPAQESLRPPLEVPGAFGSTDANRPAGADVRFAAGLLAVHEFGSGDDAAHGTIRIVDFDGTLRWEGDDLPVASPSAWAPDGSALALQDDGGWRLVNLDAGEVTEQRIAVTDAIPFGFSNDGRWIYGAVPDADGVVFRPAVSVDRSTGVVTPIDRYPVGAPDGIAPYDSAATTVDPATGRLLSRVREHDGQRIIVFGPEGREPVYGRSLTGLSAVLGRAWAGDGRLLVLRGDARSRPAAVELVPLDASGVQREPLLTAGPLLGASIVGARDGHVLLAFAAEPSEVLLVLYRVSDGAAAQLLLHEGDLSHVVGLALVPAQ